MSAEKSGSDSSQISVAERIALDAVDQARAAEARSLETQDALQVRLISRVVWAVLRDDASAISSATSESKMVCRCSRLVDVERSLHAKLGAPHPSGVDHTKGAYPPKDLRTLFCSLSLQYNPKSRSHARVKNRGSAI